MQEVTHITNARALSVGINQSNEVIHADSGSSTILIFCDRDLTPTVLLICGLQGKPHQDSLYGQCIRMFRAG